MGWDVSFGLGRRGLLGHPPRNVWLGAITRQVKQRGSTRMFSHIMVGAKNIDASKRFYDAVLGAIGVKPGFVDRHRVFWRSPTGTFAASLPIDGEPASHANGGTVGFTCESPEAADAWHAAGVANGGETCEEPPGWREGPMGKLYLAYLRDPAGNKICGLHRG